MAFKGKWGTYVHVPKCGGLAIRNWLTANFTGGTEVGDTHGLPLLVEDNTFTVIRDPVTWLRSLWTYRLRDGWGDQTKFVYNWPPIVAMTKWIERTSWNDFVTTLYAYDYDIVMNVYGFYNHPKVKIFKLENLKELQDYLEVEKPVPHTHKGTDLPTITRLQMKRLKHVCRASRAKYGYNGRVKV